MKSVEIHTENPNPRTINQAVKVLENGGLLIYPTDTVYGIGCNVYNKKALEHLYRLKGKSKFDPVSLVVLNIQQASRYARISNFAYRILRHCLPGPYTFILPATREIPKLMLSRRKEVGIRIPDCNVSKALLEALNYPLVNTSVSMSAEELLNDPVEIEDRYYSEVSMFLNAGWLPNPIESTIVSLVNDEVEVLREGKGDINRLLE
ncbi:threonylcarbamoyl-AMP synthase [candidate division KSB1 bacterium 4484_188]|nr:MAG: threonylcarbamoyl-AMP synthase [candidate division KSB1 bacterium 4484_188]